MLPSRYNKNIRPGRKKVSKYLMRRFSSPSWVTLSLCLAAVNTLTNWAIETSNVYIGLYALELGASRLYIGFIAAAAGIAYFASSLFFGRMSDVRGRMTFIRIGLALTAVSYVSQIFANSPLTLLAARSLVYFCIGINASVLVAYTFENQNQVGRFISYGALGWLFGALTAAAVRDYHTLFIMSSVIAFFAFIASLFLKEAAETHIKVPLFPAALIKADWKIYLALFLRQFGGNAIWSIWPLYQTSIGATNSGYPS